MKNHYDVLNLQKNCTSQEIKDAFIKLSKKYHPDKNPSGDAHTKFVQVNEAYSVLGKEDSRRRYDSTLLENSYRKANYTRDYSYAERSNMRAGRANHFDFDQWERINKYYKPKNDVIASKLGPIMFCCFLLALGVGIQTSISMKRSSDYNSRVASILLVHSQKREEDFSNEKRIKEMMDGTYKGMSVREAKALLELEKAGSSK